MRQMTFSNSGFDVHRKPTRRERFLAEMEAVVRYHQRRADDAVLRTRLRALAHERKRFGYRRLHPMLKC